LPGEKRTKGKSESTIRKKLQKPEGARREGDDDDR